MSRQEFEVGDTLTVAFTGKIVDPDRAGTGQALTISAKRPPFYIGGVRQGNVSFDVALEPDAEIQVDVKPRYPDGIHRDAAGRYWMRQGDGWFEMRAAQLPVPSVVGAARFTPAGAQPLGAVTES